ncbi:unnamed protein product [Phytophthora fragariaefolia]|uniref:Unnamed protein product n=1 Tax=Phytophthora fragariaefolia TaxID=1490495 RepID=A0A9W6X6U1_9STRA|nr:unnamed protein product [Phytophthora fragariaefolia]
MSGISPRLANDGLKENEVKLPGPMSRRSHRLSITNWRANGISEGSVTHVDVFLGSLTAISEQLASSFAEKARQRGAEVTLRSLESFSPDKYVAPKSIYRSRSRLTVFVVSTHVAGKPSPNAETFLQWLRDAPMTLPLLEANSQNSGEIEGRNGAVLCHSPISDTSNTKSGSPREQRINSPKPKGLHRHHSLTDAFLASFHINWLHSIGSEERKHNGPLLGVQYAVFGVGNSIYRTFNATAKYIDTRLHELGGVRVCSVGLGDSSKDVESVYTRWESHLLHMVSNRPNTMSISAPSTARDPTKLPVRMSLPCVTGNTGMTGQPPMVGPTPSYLTLTQAETPERAVHQRRYSSATTILRARQASSDTEFAVPPLTDRR